MILQSYNIDHTNLKPTATIDDIRKLCDEAKLNGFRGICVNPRHVNLAARMLANSSVKTISVVGFPLGANSTTIKITEAIEAFDNGANEIDVVWDLASFKDGNYVKTLVQLIKISEIVRRRYGLMKVIVETCYLSSEEIEKAFQIVFDSGADCIKTSTGFGKDDLLHEKIPVVSKWAQLRTQKQCDLKIKAAGGIGGYATAKQFIDCGADIIGTSHGIEIMKQMLNIVSEPMC